MRWKPSMHSIDRDTEAAVRRFLALIADRLEVVGAILYGSRAKGTHREDSDADVALLLKGGKPDRYQAALDMAPSITRVVLETRILISPLPIWLHEWEQPENFSNPDLLYNINTEGVKILT